VDEVTEIVRGPRRVLERERDGIANAEHMPRWAARRIRIVMSLHKDFVNVKSIDRWRPMLRQLHQATMAGPAGER